MGSAARSQWLVAAVALAIAAAAFAWIFTHRTHFEPFPPPALLSITALDPAGKARPLAEKGSLASDESLDFQIQVKAQAWVYVFSVVNQKLRFEWGHGVVDAPWEAGVYAPDWSSAHQGLRFQEPGPVELHVLAGPVPAPGAATWSLEMLRNFRSTCPRCEEARFSFEVTPAPSRAVAPPAPPPAVP